VRDTDERQQVVLADRAKGDRAGQHQLVVAFVVGERGQVERAQGEQLSVGTGHPPGGLAQAFRTQLHTQRPQESRRRALSRRKIDTIALRADD
jgi:hypothetical protein